MVELLLGPGQPHRYPFRIDLLGIASLKFSSRELFGFAAYVALTLASMRVGGVLAAFTLIVIASVAVALLIVALIDRAGRRAFAIGFLVPLLSYAAVHSFTGHDELDPFGNFALPTTRSFQPLHGAFVSSTWIDFTTGKELPDYDPTADPSRHSGGGGLMPANGMVTTRETPDRATFTLLAHSLIAVLIAMIGARFGVYIHNSQKDG